MKNFGVHGKIEAWLWLPFTKKGFVLEWLVDGKKQLLVTFDWSHEKGFRFQWGWGGGGPKVYAYNASVAQSAEQRSYTP